MLFGDMKELEQLSVIISKRKVNHSLHITSFQGTVLYPYIGLYHKLRLFLKFPFEYVSYKIKPDLVIMTNDGTRGDKVLEYFGHDNNKIVFVPNGIQINDYKNDDEVKTDECITNIFKKNKYVFVTASRLVGWKRIDRSIEVFNFLKQIESASHLIVIGDGPERNNIERIIHRYSLDASVTLLGFLPHKETLRIIKNATMLFSFCDFSNMTNSIQEAAFMKIPVATIDDGSTDIILSDQNSIKVPLNENFASNISQKILCYLKGLNDINPTKSFNQVFTWEERMNVIAKEIGNRL